MLALPGNGLGAQQPDSSAFVPGALLERVVSSGDARQSFAVLLPSRFDRHAPQPVLFLMDPRGRALVPLRLLRAAAERFGYVIFSSYNTRSDEAIDPNDAAFSAMLADAQRLLTVDPRRVYLVGFSGTARAGWDFAYRLNGPIAGLIGFGAGFPSGWTPPAGASTDLVFYGGTGTTDFNYEEVQGLDLYLERMGLRHRVVVWEGPHGWPPASVMEDALAWMELQGMRRGIIPPDSAWIDSLYHARSASAAATPANSYEAYVAFRALHADFSGLRDVATDSSRSLALARSKPVRRRLEHREEIAARYREYVLNLQQFIVKLRSAASPPPLSRALKELEIARLQRQAADSTDRDAALGAAQMLENAFVITVFYEPREAMQSGNPTRALALLDIAEAIHPGAAIICTSREAALTALGRSADAAALRCTSN